MWTEFGCFDFPARRVEREMCTAVSFVCCWAYFICFVSPPAIVIIMYSIWAITSIAVIAIANVFNENTLISKVFFHFHSPMCSEVAKCLSFSRIQLYSTIQSINLNKTIFWLLFAEMRSYANSATNKQNRWYLFMFWN